MASSEREWWKDAVLYQIYPRSYQDADGDGVGDLRGITGRLDYLEWLGVDAVWLSPIFASPHADFGYDISDYRAVDPLFGTDDDLAELRDALHGRGMRLVLDLVPNHSSDRHPWFRASRSSRDDPKRDWYIWADPALDGGPPNNWLSVFGGSAWEWDEATGQYYYHAFLKEQPDLNWRNPEVREAMLDVMRHWLDWGADGFRVDVMWHMIKDARLRDNPPNPDYDPATATRSYEKLIPAYNEDQPEVHEVVREMRRVVDAFGDRLLIGEIYLPVPDLVRYYGDDLSGAHLPFNFQLVQLPWERETVEAAIDRYEGALPEDAWPNWVLGNHDNPRVATRFGGDAAAAAAVLLLTLRGTPTLYYGDEIGMRDVEIPPELVQDPQALRDPESYTRDPCRTPMQWTDGPAAGFTDGEPWLPVADDAGSRNVEAQRDDPRSMLSLHRRLLALRRRESALRAGTYTPVPVGGSVLAYVRERRGDAEAPAGSAAARAGERPGDAEGAAGGAEGGGAVGESSRILVAVNFAGTSAGFTPDEALGGEVLESTSGREGRFATGDALEAHEAVVVRLG